MNIIKVIPVVLVILSFVFLGCVKPPVGTPVPTATPTATVQPTVFPTVPPTPTPLPVSTPTLEPIMYRVWIDSDYGFYRVRAIRGNSTLDLPPDFNILNFTIKVGDSVRWINDDSYDFPLTIVLAMKDSGQAGQGSCATRPNALSTCSIRLEPIRFLLESTGASRTRQ